MSAVLTPPGPGTVTPPPRLSPVAPPAVYRLPFGELRRIPVDEYERMAEAGVFANGERFELLDGFLVKKMSQHPPHASAITSFQDLAAAVKALGWVCRPQLPLKLSASMPEPDLVIARGDRRTYQKRHPDINDLGIVIEVSDSTIASDRAAKLRIYAAERVPIYWVVNIPSRAVEVYTMPQFQMTPASYGQCQTYRDGDQVAIELDGHRLMINVSDILPLPDEEVGQTVAEILPPS